MKFLSTLWANISELGVTEKERFQKRQAIRVINQFSVVLALLATVYFVYSMFFIPDITNTHPLYYTFHLGIVLCSGLMLLFNYLGYFQWVRYFVLLFIYTLVVYSSWQFAEPFRTEPYLFVMATFLFVVFHHWRIIIPLFIVIAITYYMLALNTISSHSLYEPLRAGLELRVVVYFSSLFFALFFLRKETKHIQQELEQKTFLLSEEKDNMEKINFTKDKIFSIISHDMRNPIGSLVTSLSLLQDKAISEEEFKEMIAILETQISQLQKSMDEMLVWSKAQLQGIQPKPTTYTLRPLVHELIATQRLSARNKRIICTAKVPRESIVYCDRDMLKSVINNLITNAIKFTPSGGAVSVTCSMNKNKTYITVEDTGVGIPNHALDKIFSDKIHYTTFGTNNEKGTGLGLIMCKEFVEKNNGKLLTESEDGKGAKFIVVLPSDFQKA